MNKIIHKKPRISIEKNVHFKKARRLIFKLQILENRTEGRGRTLIPTVRIRAQARVHARRAPASARRATTDSGGDDGDGGGGDPEPPRSHPCSLPASVGGAL
jgi:hypothetical protein